MTSEKQQFLLNDILNESGNKALTYLYDNTLSKVRKYVMKNSGLRDEADDIFQDAVIVFFQKVKENKYDPQMNLEAFVYTVARNLWIDKARRDKRMLRYENVGQFEYKSDYSDQLNVLIEKEKTSAMRKVFEMLDEKCQKILHYYLFEKKSMKEISQLMGYSSDDVAKTNHYRCKGYLSKLVQNDKQLVNLLKN
jgi:RNA polymerase sigma factor (sigma-70 family)